MTTNNCKQKLIDLKEQAKNKYDNLMTDMKNPVKRAVWGRKTSEKATSIFRGFIIFGLSFIILFPIFQQFTLALRDPSDLANPMIIWIPETWSTLNFKIAYELLHYFDALKNNFMIATVTTILQLIVTALAGYAFARLKFKGSNIIFWILMLTLIVPPQGAAISKYLYFLDFDVLGIIGLFNGGNGLKLTGVGNTEVLYILAATGQGVRAALFIFIFRQTFRGLPIELEESAQIDGAGIFKTFYSVMLPNARGAIVTVMLFAFVWQWNDVLSIKTFEISDSETFPILTMQLLTAAERLPALLRVSGLELLVSPDIRQNQLFLSVVANTSALLMMLPLMIGYLFVQRQFVEGVERSGIVG